MAQNTQGASRVERSYVRLTAGNTYLDESGEAQCCRLKENANGAGASLDLTKHGIREPENNYGERSIK